MGQQNTEKINSREDLASFIEDLQKDLQNNPSNWANRNLASYLEAITAWLRDMDGFLFNRADN